jgi:putative hydrolase of the HAD superfamily
MDYVINNIKLLPGFEEILPKLSGYKLAIFSEDSKELLYAKLDSLNIRDYFKIIISSDDIGEMKPSIKYFDSLFKKLKINPYESLVVGDNYAKDLAIPKSLGAKVVLVSCSNNYASTKPDYKICDYRKFMDILKEM